MPTFYYQVNGTNIKKTIAIQYGKNLAAIEYEFTPNFDGEMELEPYFNYRDHGDVSTIEDLKFKVFQEAKEIALIPSKSPKSLITLTINEGTFIKNNDPYSKPLVFQYDFENGDERVDYSFIPYKIKVSFKKGITQKISIIVKINEDLETNNLNLLTTKIINQEKTRMENLVKQTKLDDNLAKDLVVASDAFIVKRNSTGLSTIIAGYPWFTDWGRDTMIAFTGLTLVTRRFQEAKEILASFAKYEKNGLIPNMFPDNGQEPIYNTVDASLWYFYASYKYAIYSGDYQFIQETIYPILEKILDAYQHGTDFSIYMDDDYLIHAGSNQDQITWMDVRTHGIAVTPRHGKPVEINALWYNALMIMDYFAKKFDYQTDEYYRLAQKVKKSFNQKFYCESKHSLYDVVDPYDDKVRPNQVFIFCLPYMVLEEKYQKDIFETIEKELYNVYGLRSLSYLDQEFKPKYTGSLDNRDYAYHMGTTWGFLIGGYLDGYAKVHQNDSNCKEKLTKIVKAFLPHLNDGCIGGIAEVFDGDIAQKGKGCFSQAWSVGELLRGYYENILK